MGCEFCQMPPEDERFLLAETEYWKVYLSYDQSFLGRCIIPLKRHAPDLPSLTSAEWHGYIALVAKLEATIRRTLGATLFNWACLMNAAYQESPPEPHVHWHLRPRYAEPVEFAGVRFVDTAFGHHYKHGARLDVPLEARLEIARVLRDALQ